ncbi:MAG: hypothetical protein IIC82_03870 [Chloroflexi bacterium]|nr:hypothetical protein [Chloroflexota bacterium]
MKTSEHVHHVDFNRKNNDRKNMVICSSSYHARIFHNIHDGRLKHEDITDGHDNTHVQSTATEDIYISELLSSPLSDADGPWT